MTLNFCHSQIITDAQLSPDSVKMAPPVNQYGRPPDVTAQMDTTVIDVVFIFRFNFNFLTCFGIIMNIFFKKVFVHRINFQNYRLSFEVQGMCPSGLKWERRRLIWLSLLLPPILSNHWPHDVFITDVHFKEQSNKDCNRFINITTIPSTDLEACKIWCGNNERCGGFTVNAGKCWFKDTTCDRNIISRAATLFLKRS